MVVALDAAGARAWSTYYGGTGDENGTAIAVNPAGSLLLTGTTTSAAGIATPFALQPDSQGGLDVFLAKLDGAGQRRWGTYYGGAGDDFAGAGSVATFGPADIVLAGHTASPTGVTTPDALFQPDFGGGPSDGFLAHLGRSGWRCGGAGCCTSG